MDAERDDDALMRAWAAGEAEAFEPLYSRHRSPLFRFLLRQLRVQATAERVFLDVWQHVVASRGRFRPGARFATWLYQVASQRLAEQGRTAPHRPIAPHEGMAGPERNATPGPPGQALSVFEERRRLQRALEALPTDQREVVVLRLEQALSLDEIAAITGAHRETVQSRLRDAMGALKARLSRGGGTGMPRATGSDR